MSAYELNDAFAEFLSGECWEYWGKELTESHPLTKVYKLWTAQKNIDDRTVYR